MRESIVREFQLRVSNLLSASVLEAVSKELCVVLDEYDVEKRCIEVALKRDIIPEEMRMYLVGLTIEGRSKNTTNNYLLVLKDFFYETQKAICEVKSNDIRVYLYRYEQSKQVSKSTVEQRRIILRAFFEWAANEGIISCNPVRAIKAIKYEAHDRQPLTQIELEQIRHVCKDTREKAIIEFLYSTGCRVSELCNVKLSDIDFVSGEVKLFGKGSKHRISYINARAAIVLQEYLSVRSGESDFLFCSMKKPYRGMHKAGIEKIVMEIMDRIPSISKHVTPHVFRHTTATQALSNGMSVDEISQLLGHVKISTTMIYAKTAVQSVKNSHKKYIV